MALWLPHASIKAAKSLPFSGADGLQREGSRRRIARREEIVGTWRAGCLCVLQRLGRTMTIRRRVSESQLTREDKDGVGEKRCTPFPPRAQESGCFKSRLARRCALKPEELLSVLRHRRGRQTSAGKAAAKRSLAYYHLWTAEGNETGHREGGRRGQKEASSLGTPETQKNLFSRLHCLSIQESRDTFSPLPPPPL